MTGLKHTCSFDKEVRTCDYTCFACTFMHGVEGGRGGMWATTGVPKKYRGLGCLTSPLRRTTLRHTRSSASM